MRTPDWQRLSDYLVMLVQIVFGVVIAQSLSTFQVVLVHPFTSAHTSALLALLTVYLTTVLSWIDWHSTMLASPYNLSFHNEARSWEQVRLYTDVGVVVTYAYLLFSIVPFVERPDGRIGWHLFGYVVVYALYLLSGWTRKRSYGPAASSYPPIILFLAFVSTFVAAYFLVDHRFGNTQWSNALWIGSFLISSIAYRRFRRRYRKAQSRRKRAGLKIGFDVDGVLGNQIAGVLPRIEKKFGITLAYEDITNWRLPVADSDIAREIEEALTEASYILEMPVHTGAVDAPAMLFPNHRILVLTARPDDTRPLSEQWLHNSRIPFDELVGTREAMKSLHGADVLIDDYVENIKEFLGNSRGHAVLVDQPWNRDRDDLAPWLETGRLRIVNGVADIPQIIGDITRERASASAQS